VKRWDVSERCIVGTSLVRSTREINIAEWPLCDYFGFE
jgi:hypothetical protein